MENAIADKEGSQEISISKQEVNELPLQRYEGKIVLVADDAVMLEAVAELEREDFLGFDTESRPTFRRGQNFPPSLLQLAGSQCVYLFQLQALTDLEPLFALLSSETPVKAGVAIRDDIKKLQEVREFEPGGFVEIADISQKLGLVNTGLRSLAGLLLGFRISKGAQVSNWAKRNLTPAQIHYAATDAWVSRMLYHTLTYEHPLRRRMETNGGRSTAVRSESIC
ncbi:MAG: 3'-5' exonuclease domain-containing protein 2 [Verrucomicrobia bacterium]|nr:3'-5' exonuclease domain-containing protein 2 [Verrucomicrobiota bacterium]